MKRVSARTLIICLLLGIVGASMASLWYNLSYKKSTAYLLRLLESQEELDRVNAALVLSSHMREDGVAHKLGLSLSDESELVRQAAARTLANAGGAAEPALEKLILATTDRDQQVRRSVISALGNLGPKAESGRAALIEALSSDDGIIHNLAAESLGKIDNGSQEVIDALVAYISASGEGARPHLSAISGVQALAEIVYRNPSAMDRVEQAMKDHELDGIYIVLLENAINELRQPAHSAQ